MKFNFKIQKYQTDAVNAVVKVFNGQAYHARTKYIRDVGNNNYQLRMFNDEEDLDIGYKNDDVALTDTQLLQNIHNIQSENNIKLSSELTRDLGRCSLDVEMETGTGKTYVYIKTIFELNKQYGWTKFIIVVPSIAIREGVKKSFEMTADHFMEHYGKKARFFVYNSSKLNDIDSFSSSANISVMIINTQAFATSLKEGGKSKESRIIYDKRDEFNSRRPIDVIKANRPIIILDEPQKMGGSATQTALKNFNPLFSINYSATHAKQHDLVYVLDALEAYNQRLVKKIEVKGFDVKNYRGTEGYLYLEQIKTAPDKPPVARIELEIKYEKSINRETRLLNVDDNLYITSNGLEQYRNGYVISEIDPMRNCVTFLNGEIIYAGDVVGDISEGDMRRIQIRETILSHFEKEEKLFDKGIKTLSLFFIDEVAKYRQYDENGEQVLGEYGKIFEQEYAAILNDYLDLIETPYQNYLKSMCDDVAAVHKGYFSIDKNGKSIDSTIKRGSDISDDISAYDLILKNKERLLSFDEPTRFIFSHSALREGWDNPNIFQICTLKHSDSQTMKRQEVGRGLRLCVNKDGNRMDADALGSSVHNINMLTVIASESYSTFVADLQKDIKRELYDRPSKATKEYFVGKSIIVDEQQVIIDDKTARAIYKYLLKNDYIDDNDNVSQTYRDDLAQNKLVELPEDIQSMTDGVHKLVQAIFDESVLRDMFANGHDSKITDNPLNDNFKKKEFQELWRQINHKYAYTVQFDSVELIEKAIKSINEKLYVSSLQYTVTKGSQKENMNEHEVDRGASFGTIRSETRNLQHSNISGVKYDLVGKIAEGTKLTRKTVVAILKGMKDGLLTLFNENPEEFISKVVHLINEQKATMVVEHVSYNIIDGEYDSSIFTAERHSQSYDKAFKARKAIQEYIYTDGMAKNSVEKRFAQELDIADEVCVYAKLPKGFYIPTPVGKYTPDWAIAFKEGTVKHIFFIAETKGSMSSMELRPIEAAKINCAKKLFNEISTEKVRYGVVDDYGKLLSIMNSIE